MKLKDKVSIVTGAGCGIGRGIAEVFARQGAKVVIAEINPETGQAVADGIVADGGEAIFIQCDVSSEEAVRKLVEKIIETHGRIDVLVNNAGVSTVRPFEQSPPEYWDSMMAVDLRGAYLCCWLVIPEMLKTGGGAIVNIASVHTMGSLSGSSPYGAAKRGIVGMTKALAVEYAERNVRLNVLSPGLIDTGIWAAIKKAAPTPKDAEDHWKGHIPMNRVGTIEEMGHVAAFLASDEASYVTGSNLLADGGMTSQLIGDEPFEGKNVE